MESAGTSGLFPLKLPSNAANYEHQWLVSVNHVPCYRHTAVAALTRIRNIIGAGDVTGALSSWYYGTDPCSAWWSGVYCDGFLVFDPASGRRYHTVSAL